MPCDCEEEEKKLVKLRFTGGKHIKRGARGPYLSYDTGKIYEVSAENERLSYWEAIDEKIEIEIDLEYSDKDAPSTSRGLTRGFTGRPPSPEDFIMGMDETQLKDFIKRNGGMVDGRWGIEKLRAEALALQ